MPSPAEKNQSGFQRLAACKIESKLPKRVLLKAAEEYLDLYEKAHREIQILGHRKIPFNPKAFGDDLSAIRATFGDQATQQVQELAKDKMRLKYARDAMHPRHIAPLDALLIENADLVSIGRALTGKKSRNGCIDTALAIIGIGLEDLARHFPACRIYGT